MKNLQSKANAMSSHFRQVLPAPIMREAKHLRRIGVAITDIHRILSDVKCHVKVPGFKNRSINYYDLWKQLGDNKRAASVA